LGAICAGDATLIRQQLAMHKPDGSAAVPTAWDATPASPSSKSDIATGELRNFHLAEEPSSPEAASALGAHLLRLPRAIVS